VSQRGSRADRRRNFSRAQHSQLGGVEIVSLFSGINLRMRIQNVLWGEKGTRWQKKCDSSFGGSFTGVVNGWKIWKTKFFFGGVPKIAEEGGPARRFTERRTVDPHAPRQVPHHHAKAQQIPRWLISQLLLPTAKWVDPLPVRLNFPRPFSEDLTSVTTRALYGAELIYLDKCAVFFF